MGFSQYPNQIDDASTLPVTTDLVTRVRAEVVNRLRSAIIAAQAELGTQPSGTFGTVRARLNALDATFATIEADISAIEADISALETAVQSIIVGALGLSDVSPTNISKSPAVAGTGTAASREDHKHDVATATAVSVGAANAEGNSTSLARANHTHAITDLAIASQEQGSILYFDGSNWVELPPGDDGYALTTHDTGADPTWEMAISGVGTGTDNHIMRWDGSSGAQDSLVSIDDAGDITLLESAYLRLGLVAGSGAGSAAATGGLRMQGNGAVQGQIVFRNAADDGDVAGMSCTAGDVLNIGGNFPTRPPTIKLDGDTKVVLATGGTSRLDVQATHIELVNCPLLRFDYRAVSPSVIHETDATVGVTGDDLTIHAQDVSGATDPIGGGLILRSGGDAGGSTNIPSGNVELYCGAIAGSGTRGTVYVGIDSSATAANRANNVILDSFAGVTMRRNGSTRAVVSDSQLSLYSIDIAWHPTSSVNPEMFQVTDSTISAAGDTLTIHAQDVSGSGDPTGGGLILRSGGDAGGSTDIDSGNVELYPGPIAGSGTRGTVYVGIDSGATAANRAESTIIDAASSVDLRAGGAPMLTVASNLVTLIALTLQWHRDTVTPLLQQADEASTSHGATLTIHAQDNTNAGAYDGGDLDLYAGDSVAGTPGDVNIGGENVNITNVDGTIIYATFDSSGGFQPQGDIIFPADLDAPDIYQLQNDYTDGYDLTITAQQGATGTYDGGDLYLLPGDDGGSGTVGEIKIGGDGSSISAKSTRIYGDTISFYQITAEKLRIGGNVRLLTDITWMPTVTPDVYQETSAVVGVTGLTFTIHAQDVSGTSDPTGGGLILRSGGDAGGSTDVGSGNVEIFCGAVAASGTRGQAYFGRDAASTAANRAWYSNIDGSSGVNLQYGGSTRLQIANTLIRCTAPLFQFDDTVVNPSIEQQDDTTDSITGDTLTVQAQNATGATTTGGNLSLLPGTGTSANGNVLIGETSGNHPNQVAINADYFYVQDGSTFIMVAQATVVDFYPSSWRWNVNTSSPNVTQASKTTASATGELFTVRAQVCTGQYATGGDLLLWAGDGSHATDGTGGDVTVRAGHGLTANGIVNIQGDTIYLKNEDASTTFAVFDSSTGFQPQNDIVFPATLNAPDIYQATSAVTDAVGYALTAHAQDVSGAYSASNPHGGDLVLRSGGDDSASAANVDSGNVEVYCGVIKGSGIPGNLYLGRDAANTAATRPTNTYVTGKSTIVFKIDAADNLLLGSTYCLWSVPDLRFASGVVTPTIYQVTDSATDAVGDTFTQHAQDVSGDYSASNPHGGHLVLRSGGDDSATASNIDSGDVEIYTGAVKGTGDRGVLYLGRDAANTVAYRPLSTIINAQSFLYFQLAGGTYGLFTSTYFELGHGDLRFGNTVASPVISHETDGTAGVTGDDLTFHAQDVSGSSDPVGGGLILRSGGNAGGSTDVGSGDVEIFCGAVAASGARGNLYLGRDSGGTAANRAGYVYLQPATAVYIGQSGNVRLTIDSSAIKPELDIQFSSGLATPEIYQADETTTANADTLTVRAQTNTNVTSGEGGDIIVSAGSSTAGTDGYAYLRGDTILLQDVAGTTTYVTFDDENTAIFHTDIEFTNDLVSPSISQAYEAGTSNANDLTIQAQTNTNATSGEGGDLILEAGGSTATLVAPGDVYVKGGIAAAGIDGNVYIDTRNTYIRSNDGATTYLALFTSELTLRPPTVQFYNDVSAPTITQADITAGSTAETLTIKAQSNTNAGSTGGHLVLEAGEGVTADGSVLLKSAGATVLTVADSFIGFAQKLIISHGEIYWEFSATNPRLFHGADANDGVVGDTMGVSAQDVSGDTTPTGGGIYLRSGGSEAAISTNVNSGNVEIFTGAIKGTGTPGTVYVGKDSGGTTVNRANWVILDSVQGDIFKVGDTSVLSVTATTVVTYQDIMFDSGAQPAKVYQETVAGVGGSFTIQAQDSRGSAVTAGSLNLLSGGDETGTNISSGHIYMATGAPSGSGVKGNISLNSTTGPSGGWDSMENGIFVGDATTAPVGGPTSGFYLYSTSGSPGIVTEDAEALLLDAQGTFYGESQATSADSPVTVFTLSPGNGTSTLVYAGCVACNDTDDFRGGWILAATIDVNVGGTASIVTSVTEVHKKVDGDLTFFITVSGDSWRLEIDPNSANPTNWRWWVKYMVVV